MPVLVNLKSYLADLERNETARPEKERRQIPTLAELADVVGMHRISFYRIANNQIGKLDLEIADKVIAEMQRRGFPMQINDFLIYIPHEQVGQ